MVPVSIIPITISTAVFSLLNYMKRLGNQVGYQIRMEAKRSKNTKLLFCTTGVILRRLQDDRDLKSITHVIVDEVHERQVQTDVLLIALRQLLRTTRRDLKVVLVSQFHLLFSITLVVAEICVSFRSILIILKHHSNDNFWPLIDVCNT